MNIGVFGLGYVGTVSAACLASSGHRVYGVDNNPTKVDLINIGISPVIEQDLSQLIGKAVQDELLQATIDVDLAVSRTDLSFVCVGTPSQTNGSLDLGYVKHVCWEIGCALRRKNDFHVIVVRSTMLPGSMRSVVIPVLESASEKSAGSDFGVCIHPEFLREGSSVFDYHQPPKIVIGETDTRSGDRLLELYPANSAPLIRTNIESAEMVKYADNAWHALKVSFANEIGNLCKSLAIDGQHVMDIFCQDIKLNLSNCYLKPGFALGGSCLPKNLRALSYKGKMLDLELPLLNSILVSNQRQIEKGIRMIADKGNKKIGILGFSFKAGTDDLRESPMITVIEYLLGKGYELRLFDNNVKLAALTGANRKYIYNAMPHISKLMVASVDELINFADTVVLGNNAKEFQATISSLRENQVVVDLAGVRPEYPARLYDGICW